MWRFSKEFLNIRWQEAVLKEAVLWRGRPAVKIRLDKKRVTSCFPPKSRLPSLVLDCYICDAVETTSTNRSGASDGGAVLCTWHETWGQPVQETTTTATSRPWQEQRDNLNQAGGREEGRGVMSNFLKQTCAEEEKKTENDFGRTFLKLCWVMIGWLPPLPISCHRHRQQVHFIHL